MAEERRIKPKARSAAAQSLPKPPDPLGEGDHIEYGNTMEVKTRSGSFWPKIAVSSKVRPGETGEEALERLVDFVNTNLAEQVEALK
jgi:hypothetical protein